MFYYEGVGVDLSWPERLGRACRRLYDGSRFQGFDRLRIFTLHSSRKATAYGKIAFGMGAAALLLTACHRPAPVTAPQAAATPVGHIYAVAVAVPPPVSPKIKFTPAEQEKIQQAFNVVALKSALMVAALSCDQRDKYDAFMHSFQPHVLESQREMDAYFHKASGPYSGQKMEDTFITLLANNQSVAGIAQGQIFCLNNQAEYNAVLALKTPDQLDSFVTDAPPGATTQVASAAVPAAVPAPAKAEHKAKSVSHKKPVEKVKAKTASGSHPEVASSKSP